MMGYQVPKTDHPWRQYGDKKFEAEVEKSNIKSVKMFVAEISDSWDNVEVVTTAYSRYGKFKLAELPQEKQAAWLAGILRRNYS